MTDASQRIGLVTYFANTFLTLLAANMFHYSMVLLSNLYVGSPAFTGAVYFCIFLPIAVLTPFAGKALDRYNRKALAVLGQSLTLLALLGLVVLITVPIDAELRPSFMITLALIMGSSLAVVVPARLTFLADIVDETALKGAAATTGLLTLLGLGLAPFSVDFVKSLVGWTWLGVVIVGFHLFGMTLLRWSRSIRLSSVDAGAGGSFREYLSANPIVFQALLVTALFFSAMGPLQVLLPRYVVEDLGVSELQRGLVMYWLGSGLLVGSVAARLWVGRTQRFGWGVIFLGGLLGVAVVIIATTTNAGFGAVLLGVCGFALGCGSNAVGVVIQQYSDDAHRGQTMAAFSGIFQLVPAIFGLAGGFVASGATIPTALAFSGALLIFGTASVAVFAQKFTSLGQLNANQPAKSNPKQVLKEN